MKTMCLLFLFSGPPLLTHSRLLSPDTLMIKWNHSLEVADPMQAAYTVYYKESTNDTIATCMTNIMECNITQLKVNSTYFIVIERKNGSSFEFVPSNIYTITIKGTYVLYSTLLSLLFLFIVPDAINKDAITSLVYSNPNETLSSVSLEWIPTFLHDTTVLSYAPYCHNSEQCMTGEITTNNSYVNITGLIQGLNYTVTLIATNPVGQSHDTVITINQTQRGIDSIHIDLNAFIKYSFM